MANITLTPLLDATQLDAEQYLLSLLRQATAQNLLGQDRQHRWLHQVNQVDEHGVEVEPLQVLVEQFIQPDESFIAGQCWRQLLISHWTCLRR